MTCGDPLNFGAIALLLVALSLSPSIWSAFQNWYEFQTTHVPVKDYGTTFFI